MMLLPSHNGCAHNGCAAVTRRLRSAARLICAAIARVSLAAALAFGGVAATALSAPAAAAAPAADLDVVAAEAQFLDLLNADRIAYGLQPLQPDPRLMEIARWRSQDMVARNYFSHDIGGYNVFQVMRDRQISFKAAGENLAYNTFDEAQTVNVAQSSLMNSPTHRQNILRSSFTLVGVGIAVGPGQKTIYTQIFIRP